MDEYSDDDPDYVDYGKFGQDDNQDLRDMFSESESEDDKQISHEFIPNYENSELRNAGKPKKKKRGGGQVYQLSDENSQILQEAMEAYTGGDYDTAIALTEHIIKSEPKVLRTWQLLGAIYEDLGDKTRELTAKMASMHLDKKNREGWIEVAELSYSLGFIDQALKCYQLAAGLDEEMDEDLAMLRVELYEQKNQPGRALDLLYKLRRNNKQDKDLLTRITHNLVNLNKINEAIQLYEDLLRKNKEIEDIENAQLQEFGLSELNILAELYYRQNSFEKAISTIKNVSRWLAGREDETYWDSFQDDTEFFKERRIKVAKYQKSEFRDQDEAYDIPIDIRVKLLTCRAKMRNLAESKAHLKYLRELSPQEYEDLYFEVAKVYQEVGEFELALDLFLQRYEAIGEFDEDCLMAPYIARCYREQGLVDDAVFWYNMILESDQKSVEILVELAEMYEDNKMSEECQNALDQVHQLKEELAEKERAQKERVVEGPDDDSHAFITHKPRAKYKSRRTPKRMSRDEREAAARKEEQAVMEKFALYKRYHEQVQKGDDSAMSLYRRRMVELYGVFSAHRRFFPSNKSQKYAGEGLKRGRTAKLGIEERIQQISSRLRDTNLEGDDDSKEVPTSFRGVSFDDWFELCMRYALLEAKENRDDPRKGLSVIEQCQGANIFHNDEWKRERMVLVYGCCALLSEDAESINEYMRYLGNSHQFYNDLYRLYPAMLSSGASSREFFFNNNNQKYFMRHIKAIDGLVQNKQVDGAARIVNENVKVEQINPILLTMYAHIMLGGRSFVPALKYLMLASTVCPNDATILFTCGISHIHRAMQRQSSNRHLQVMEGLSYLLDYRRVRAAQGAAEAQEADFNLGRAFHMLSLGSLAVKFYHRVLDGPTVGDRLKNRDLKPNAAYNLHIIYCLSGNRRLAQKIINSYITI